MLLIIINITQCRSTQMITSCVNPTWNNLYHNSRSVVAVCFIPLSPLYSHCFLRVLVVTLFRCFVCSPVTSCCDEALIYQLNIPGSQRGPVHTWKCAAPVILPCWPTERTDGRKPVCAQTSECGDLSAYYLQLRYASPLTSCFCCCFSRVWKLFIVFCRLITVS